MSHSGFMRSAVTGCWFYNADYRIFDYQDRHSPDAEYRLQQWDLTSAATYDEKEGKNNSGGLKKSWAEPVTIGTFPAYLRAE